MDGITLSNTNVLRGVPPEVMDSYLSSLDVKPVSREAYANAVRAYSRYLDAYGLDGTDRADVIAFKDSMTGYYAPATISLYMTGIRSFYRYLNMVYGVPDVTQGVKGARRAPGFSRDALTSEQVARVLSGVPRDSPQGLRDYALINLLVRTGIRTVEAVRADVGDVRVQGNATVLYVQGKGRDSKDEYVVLTRNALGPILDYLRTRPDVPADAPLFVSESKRNMGQRLTTDTVSRVVKEAMRMAGIKSDRLTAHSLRHTAITLALEGGASVQEVQALARHSDISTTMIYAHNIERMKGVPESSIDRMLEAVQCTY